jgi:hypothetical protein
MLGQQLFLKIAEIEETYATIRHSSAGSRKVDLIARRMLVGRCIGAMYAMISRTLSHEAHDVRIVVDHEADN